MTKNELIVQMFGTNVEQSVVSQNVVSVSICREFIPLSIKFWDLV